MELRLEQLCVPVYRKNYLDVLRGPHKRNATTIQLQYKNYFLVLQLTTPLLLRKPCKLFASVARVCQRQLAFLVLHVTITSKIV